MGNVWNVSVIESELWEITRRICGKPGGGTVQSRFFRRGITSDNEYYVKSRLEVPLFAYCGGFVRQKVERRPVVRPPLLKSHPPARDSNLGLPLLRSEPV